MRVVPVVFVLSLGMACQGFPKTEVVCAESDRCAPFSAVYGQPDALTNLGAQRGVNGPRHSLINGNQLLVADSTNSRILIWDTFPTVNQQPPSRVFGQQDLNYNTADPAASAKSLFEPRTLALLNGRFLIGDRSNNRILIWNRFPTESKQAADVVVGQNNFSSNADPIAINEKTLFYPHVAVLGNRMVVCDERSHRVLIWNSVPTSNGQPADLVLGQPNKTSGMSGLGPNRLAFPEGTAASDGTRLFVPDTGNHRILIWNTWPTMDGQPADAVLGQPNLMSGVENQGGRSARSLALPRSLHMVGNRLYASDTKNGRVLIWNNVPVGMNQVPADLVLGQDDFASARMPTYGSPGKYLYDPRSVVSDGMRLVITDTFNNRVLIWNRLPTQNGMNADLVLGQPDLNSDRPNSVGQLDASSLSFPQGVHGSDEIFAVTDTKNWRVLLWRTPPRGPTDLPDLVLGQPNFTGINPNSAAPGASDLAFPQGLFTDGTRLIVSDNQHHRVLIWSSIPSSSYAPADIVVGQPNPTSFQSNAGQGPAQGLNAPFGVHFDGTRLYVADTFNHRVLIWNALPTRHGAPPDIVVGQTDLNGAAANLGGPVSARGLNYPIGVTTYENSLLVTEYGNFRVLLWRNIPTTNGQPADLVLGQSSLTATDYERPASARTLRRSFDVKVYDGRLYVADTENHRVLYWNALPTTSEQPADGVFGQPDLNSNAPNNGGLSADRLNGPTGMFVSKGLIYLSDQSNNRITIRSLP